MEGLVVQGHPIRMPKAARATGEVARKQSQPGKGAGKSKNKGWVGGQRCSPMSHEPQTQS